MKTQTETQKPTELKQRNRSVKASSLFVALVTALAFTLAACSQEVSPPVEDVTTQSSYVCPIPGEGVSFEDTWGNARSEGRSHKGTDMFAPTNTGTPLVAVTDGTVVYAKSNKLGGNTVKIKEYGSDQAYYYAHLRENNPYADGISAGVPVTKGQVIGYMGSTGNSGSPHLHFGHFPGLTQDNPANPAINPYPYLLEWCSTSTPNPPTPPAPTGWPTLSRGSSNHSAVMTLQYLLKASGATQIAVDGDFGPQTENIVRFVQGADATGIVDDAFWSSLVSDFTLREGNQGTAVKALQQRMTDKGYTLTVDGDFGSVTRSKVVAFQQDAGITVDGWVGAETWQALMN